MKRFLLTGIAIATFSSLASAQSYSNDSYVSDSSSEYAATQRGDRFNRVSRAAGTDRSNWASRSERVRPFRSRLVQAGEGRSSGFVKETRETPYGVRERQSRFDQRSGYVNVQETSLDGSETSSRLYGEKRTEVESRDLGGGRLEQRYSERTNGFESEQHTKVTPYYAEQSSDSTVYTSGKDVLHTAGPEGSVTKASAFATRDNQSSHSVVGPNGEFNHTQSSSSSRSASVSVNVRSY